MRARRAALLAIVAAVAAALVAVGLGGCGAIPGPPSDPPATAPVSTPAATGVPGVDADQQFGFDDVAEFDGLEISTAGTQARAATATERGAEATGGQIVVVSILITNRTRQSYDPRSAVITALYGPQDTPAAMITDSTAELQSGFDAPIAAGAEGTAVLGFAVPASGLDRVTFVVDPSDDVYGVLSFTGRVEPG